MFRLRSFSFWLFLSLSWAPLQAQAHLDGLNLDDFWSGALQPLTTLGEVLAFAALGLLAGQSDEPTGLKVAATFSAMLAFGAYIAMYLVERPWIGWTNLSSLLILGTMVALALRFPPTILVTLAAIFGTTHGVASGMEIEDPIEPLVFIPGLALSGFL